MDEHKNPIPEGESGVFTLEDILREFGSQSDDGKVHEYQAPELMEDLPQLNLLSDTVLSDGSSSEEEPELLTWASASAQAPETDLSDTQSFTPIRTASDALEGDTVRIDTARIRAQMPAAEGDTIRIDTNQVRAQLSDTQTFTPITDPVPEPVSEEAEPFSENWEPQFDQPIGEYVPPEPIIFRPRSRLGELKRKLMEGPEQRYYALSEQGVGKLQIALFVCMLIVVLAVASIVLHRLDMVRENRMRLLVFSELFAMLVCALLCWERLADGIGSLFTGKFNTDTLLTFSFAACIADGIFCLQEVKVPFCAAFCLEALMCLWSEYQKRSTELHQMDTLRKATRLGRVSRAPDCYDGRPGFHVSEGEPEDFMDTYSQPTAPGKALDRFALFALIASVAVAVLAGLNGGLRAGVRTWSAAILAACPATMLISQSRPMWTLQRRLYRFGSLICGWKGVKAASGKVAVPISDEDLLPGGSVKINGVKFYSGRNPDTIIGYATAVMSESGSCLAPLFEHMLSSRRAQRYEVDEFKTYGDFGLGAIVCGESVLVGTQEFLRDKGVELPAGTKINQAVYVAIDGEFACVFALAFGKLKGVSAGLDVLCRRWRLTPVLSSCNFLLSEAFIRSKYNVNTRRMAFPDVTERERLAAWAPDPESCISCILTTQEGLAGTAFALAGARSLRTASVVGAVIHILGGIVGLGAVLALTLTGRVDLLTPANLLLLELIWAVPGLMISEWTRNI